MAITSTGIGSGLDVESIVSQLVAAERAPVENRILRNESVTNYTLSALGSLKSAMSTMRDASNALFEKDLRAYSAKSSNTDLLTATASSEATAGSYRVSVESLASSHKLVSASYTGSDALVGAGSMSLAVGDQSFSIDTDDTTTLADLRDAINDAEGNDSVSAAIIQEDGGARLVLTSVETGTANEITVGGGLASFTESQAAADALIMVEGFSYTSSSNTIDDAINGVTLNLVEAEPGTDITVNVTQDSSKLRSSITTFVNSWNTLAATFTEHTQYNAEEETAGALNGDGATRSLQQQLRRIMTGSTSGLGDYNSLSSIGIAINTEGQFTIDFEVLDAALADDFSAVSDLFADSEQGLAVAMDTAIDPYLDSSGGQDAILDQRINNLNDKLVSYDEEIERLDMRMAQVETLYRNQFNALDSIVNQYNSISSFLTQTYESSDN